jgi:hypothetical protein
MLPPLRDLLELAGFTIRTSKSATCAHCTGHNNRTVGFNDHTAHCFRCQYTTGRYKLAKELGIISKKLSPRERIELARELRQITQLEIQKQAFNGWRNHHLKKVLDEFSRLNYYARLAKKVLAVFQDEELAWAALARLYDSEASLFSRFDQLMCTKVSRWLENDSVLEHVVEMWRLEQRGRRKTI